MKLLMQLRKSESGGSRISLRLSRKPDNRGSGEVRHPSHHRPAGTHRTAHGRRDEPNDFRTANRRVLHAERPRLRKCIRRCRASIRRLRTHCRATNGLFARVDTDSTELQFRLELSARHESCEQVTVPEAVQKHCGAPSHKHETADRGPRSLNSHQTCLARKTPTRLTRHRCQLHATDPTVLLSLPQRTHSWQQSVLSSMPGRVSTTRKHGTR